MGPSTCRDDGDGSDTSSYWNWTTWDHLHVETMEMDRTRLHDWELDNMGPSTCRDDGDGSDTSSDGNWTTWDHLHVETMEMDRTRLHDGN